MLLTTPVTLLVKISYDRLKVHEGRLADALEEAIAPFTGSKVTRWELASCRMHLHSERSGWEPSGNEYAPVESVDDTFVGAAYFEDMQELIEPTWAVLDENGEWHEVPAGPRRVDFLRDFDRKFVQPSAADTVLAVVLIWS